MQCRDFFRRDGELNVFAAAHPAEHRAENEGAEHEQVQERVQDNEQRRGKQDEQNQEARGDCGEGLLLSARDDDARGVYRGLFGQLIHGPVAEEHFCHALEFPDDVEFGGHHDADAGVVGRDLEDCGRTGIGSGHPKHAVHAFPGKQQGARIMKQFALLDQRGVHVMDYQIDEIQVEVIRQRGVEIDRPHPSRAQDDVAQPGPPLVAEPERVLQLAAGDQTLGKHEFAELGHGHTLEFPPERRQ